LKSTETLEWNVFLDCVIEISAISAR